MNDSGSSLGNDILRGGRGNDFLLGGPTDQFYGGDDTDTVTTYSLTSVVLYRLTYISGAVVSANHGVEYWSLYGTNDADSIDAVRMDVDRHTDCRL
ncbi:MAG: hypothetical protein U0930_24805 [Pirellulales bacterium]